jgi:hypothetical protein
LIPEPLPNAILGDYNEALFLLNLYTPKFLYPIFYVSDFGIMPSTMETPLVIHYQQNQSKIFKTKKFANFYKILMPQSQYGDWFKDRCDTWNDEDWRLFVASLMFTGLKTYDIGKSSFIWQREAADMSTILECLFTARDTQNEEIGYRLRKRIAVLIALSFPDIEANIKKLYKLRSNFIHGSFFSHISKTSKKSFSSLPIPPFSELSKQKEYVKFALIAYLYLSHKIKKNPDIFNRASSVIELLEKAVIDVKLRKKIASTTKEIFSFLPKLSVL